MKTTQILLTNISKASVANVTLLLICFFSTAQINHFQVVDVSISARDIPFEPKSNLKRVLAQMDLRNVQQEINLYSCVIGEAGITKVNTATLPSPNGVSKVERDRQISSFIKKAMSDFQYLGQPADHGRTEIYRTLCVIQEYFSKNASRNTCTIESDFVESGFIIDFYHSYKGNPSAILADYDKLIELFKADAPMPDFTNVEVILVNTNGDSEIALWSTRFYKKALLEAMNAKSVMVKAAH
ncbi:MAG: hypothetical protein HRT61_22980 [Ekhidna sp.]|nr:hypothetical protein [Ekhidna sp.]